MKEKTGTLVLSRKAGESIWIGKDIRIEIVQVEHNQVKIAFRAPRDIHIVREELLGKPYPQKSVG